MGVLSNLEPKSVFAFFEEICGIPHGSGNVGVISDYFVNFARERNFEVHQDALKNVIIFKEASPGYEGEETVILQGHMDMVAVKTPECTLDLKKDGLKLRVDGDLISAEGTSLGGDDGIAVAYALAILDAEDLKHPRLEVVITVDEEVGMDGARGIDLSLLRGRRLLNIDSEEEGVFTVGCAGGARVDLSLGEKTELVSGKLLKIRICGLLGGHSGTEIHKERGNSNQLMGRLLEELTAEYPFQLIHLQGGLADNAIPRETAACLILRDSASDVPDGKENSSDSGSRILVNTEKAPDVGEKVMEKAWNVSYSRENVQGKAGNAPNRDRIEEILQKFEADVKAELVTRDPGFELTWNFGQTIESAVAFSAEDSRRTALFLTSLPNGVQAMSPDVSGLVETSLNFGILHCENVPGEKKLTAGFSVRSSVESEKEALIRRLRAIGELSGAECSVRGDYPGWKYRVDSPLRDQMTSLYRKMYGREPEILAVHAGLECGLLMHKLPGLDCVSFGPDMQDIHTTEETLSISSVKRVWEFLLRFLALKA